MQDGELVWWGETVTMTMHSDSGLAEPRAASADVPLSERPLVADDQNTVITTPDRKRTEIVPEVPASVEAIRQRLFPSVELRRGRIGSTAGAL